MLRVCGGRGRWSLALLLSMITLFRRDSFRNNIRGRFITFSLKREKS